MSARALADGVVLDDAYFDVMFDHADHHWWYRARRALARSFVGDRLRGGGRALDVGCGTGDLLGVLGQLGADTAIGTDLSDYALPRARDRRRGAGASFLSCRAEALPFPEGRFGFLSSMDVIEHVDDDAGALAEYRRVLQPGATLLLSVPSYQWLWSEHDVWAAHRRRYDRAALVAVVEAAGFVVDRVTYFNAHLVAPAWLLRRTPLRRLVSDTYEEVGSSHPAVDAVCRAWTAFERLICRHVSLPFGLSLMLVGHVPPAVPGDSGRASP